MKTVKITKMFVEINKYLESHITVINDARPRD